MDNNQLFKVTAVVLLLMSNVVLGAIIYILVYSSDNGEDNFSSISFSPETKGVSEKFSQLSLEEKIILLLKKIGFDKLNEIEFMDDKPSILVIVGDNSFLFVTENNTIKRISEANPDVEVYISDSILNSLLASENLQQEILKLRRNKKITLKLLSPREILLLKGYYNFLNNFGIYS